MMKEAIAVLKADTCDVEQAKHALQALQYLVEPIDNANGSSCLLHCCCIHVYLTAIRFHNLTLHTRELQNVRVISIWCRSEGAGGPGAHCAGAGGQ